VNCTDCAAIVTTFVNILGCNLYSACMTNIYATKIDDQRFTLNKIIAIGQTSWGHPNWGDFFGCHEVAWKNSSMIWYDEECSNTVERCFTD
jgi:hypothetical protein